MKAQTVAITLSPELAELLADSIWLEREQPRDFHVLRLFAHKVRHDQRRFRPQSGLSKPERGTE